MDDSLSSTSLLRNAKRAAHKAMDDHGRRDYDEFALHAGVAVEKLAKAVLVAMNPIYIVEMRGSAEMLFHLGGHLTASKVRTIGASEAITRLRTLKILKVDTKLDLLIEVRNGVAHASGGVQAKGLLSTLAESVDTLLKRLDSSGPEFWERWYSAVLVAIDRHRSEIQRDVEIRIKQARHLFDDRFEGLPETAKEAVLKVHPRDVGFRSTMSPRAADRLLTFSSETPCPACGGLAHLMSTPIGTTGTHTELSAFWLRCRLCDLELDGADQIAASGADVEKAQVPTSIDLSWDVTPHTALEVGPTYMD
ncbi:hypothetical protein ACLQ2J_12640 [Streptomyces cyaneofuscatus]|uniref:hypothetical protein n=1 Tax=Streptomyces cyaneofuscatus TaxID=66883 RepID=UPI003CF51EF4